MKSEHRQQRDRQRAIVKQAGLAAAAAVLAAAAKEPAISAGEPAVEPAVESAVVPTDVPAVEPAAEPTCPQLQALGHKLRRMNRAMHRSAVWTQWMCRQIAEGRLRHLAERARSTARLHALADTSQSLEPSTPSVDPWKDALEASFTNARHSADCSSPRKKKGSGKKGRSRR